MTVHRRNQFVALFCIALVTAGCDVRAHYDLFVKERIHVELKPAVTVEQSTVGNNRRVVVRAIDKRTDRRVIVAGSASLIIGESVSDSMTRLHFRPVTKGDDRTASVDVQITRLEWGGRPVGLTGFEDYGTATLVAVARSGARVFRKRYHGSGVKKDREPFESPLGSMGTAINLAVSDAIMRLVSDRALIAFLAHPVTAPQK